MRKHVQAGLALVIVLWVLSLLTIMAASFALTMRRETVVISAIKDNAVALAAAETGLVIAQQMLIEPDETIRWQANGDVYSLKDNNAEIRIRILSEKGKIDINKADEALLTALIVSVNLELDKTQALVSAILDWRDKDSLVHVNGAEKQQYEDEGLSYHPANKDFQSIDELQMVLGMSHRIFQQIKPLITIYSAQKQVDINVATKEVLQVIGATEQIIEEAVLSSTQQLGSELLNNSKVVKNIKINNQAYTIISQAKTYSDALGGIQATLKNTRDKNGKVFFKVLDWQQNYQNFSLFGSEDLKISDNDLH